MENEAVVINTAEDADPHRCRPAGAWIRFTAGLAAAVVMWATAFPEARQSVLQTIGLADPSPAPSCQALDRWAERALDIQLDDAFDFWADDLRYDEAACRTAFLAWAAVPEVREYMARTQDRRPSPLGCGDLADWAAENMEDQIENRFDFNDPALRYDERACLLTWESSLLVSFVCANRAGGQARSNTLDQCLGILRG